MRRLAIRPALLTLILALAPSSIPAQTPSSKKSPKLEEKVPPNLPREIHQQILLLPFYSVFDSITFTLNGDIVTLTGQVVRPTLKKDAEAAVRSIEGVDSVVNQIEVLPVSSTDDDLRRAVYRAIYEDSTLARYAVQPVSAIHIIVKNANISLEGSVNSASDTYLAAARARSVANVLEVKNNLVVQSKGKAAE